MSNAPPVFLCGAGVLGAHGSGYAGLARAIAGGTRWARLSHQLAQSPPRTWAAEIDPLPEPVDPAERRARALMSRSAVLANLATQTCLRHARPSVPNRELGFYLGVGASGGGMDQLTTMLQASLDDGRLSWEQFGDAGLRACNPLYAFSLMNNFTLCHSAILQGPAGPNSAFFSRGGGTLLAISEAMAALIEGECSYALAGAADSAVHPVTWDELARQSRGAPTILPGEGAAIFALSLSADHALAQIDRCSLFPQPVCAPGLAAGPQSAPLLDDLRRALTSESDCDACVIATSHTTILPGLLAAVQARFGQTSAITTVDLCAALGECLAASPALGWAVALDLLENQQARRVLVLSVGQDGDLGISILRQPDGERHRPGREVGR